MCISEFVLYGAETAVFCRFSDMANKQTHELIAGKSAPHPMTITFAGKSAPRVMGAELDQNWTNYPSISIQVTFPFRALVNKVISI